MHHPQAVTSKHHSAPRPQGIGTVNVFITTSISFELGGYLLVIVSYSCLQGYKRVVYGRMFSYQSHEEVHMFICMCVWFAKPTAHYNSTLASLASTQKPHPHLLHLPRTANLLQTSSRSSIRPHVPLEHTSETRLVCIS